ncbi:LEAF RUST 10 DISEASE-RESISTANCE LOCUS RECEPTOR-LIKE PROTEIN KINASE-like 1.1 [Bidens hawaiensis]|uniref:LEAF RUST 10 DISEASE-RESISTANCE LOCUS RECEPTOR-LIKE PROTEIN KINASE-like 1.1 n=1 Tax=Bidens hawaiensis TaxID=980011 RepID=UPI00404918B3
MILVLFSVLIILACQPLLHSAISNNVSMPVCPESFSCPTFSPFKYPFYNATDKRCGLIKVKCTSIGGEIQIAGWSFDIVRNLDFNQNSLLVWSLPFDQLVKNKSCDALVNSLTSPSPLLYSISITSSITLFKCTKNVAYFGHLNYSSYKGCEDHNFYYNYYNGTVPSGLPHTCQVVQLPAKLSTISPGLDQTNIFSLLDSSAFINFTLTPSCDDCQKNRQQCVTGNQHDVHCLDVIWEEIRGRKRGIKIPVIVGSALIIILSLVIFIIWRQCKSNPFSYVLSRNKSQKLEDISLSFGVSVFTYKELEDATQNFDTSREIGDGGFGAVYYGKLKDGREVAVKKLHEHNYNRVRQFKNEVEILTNLRHPNLVVLYGCTSRQSHELLLVYEYVPNGTVAGHLHGKQAAQNLLTWPIRMNIAIETASALVYLHASEILHRDVKSTNILLDHNFSVKVADFGLSRLISNNVTHVSTALQGTPGYMDPQYHQRYQLTDKSDVYSFGVVLIELISSMVPIDLNRSQDEVGLANFALNKIQRCEIDQLIDPALGSDRNPEVMNTITLVAELAFRCLQYDSDMRPTMSEVLDVLMNIKAVVRIDAYDSIRNLQTLNVPPLSETNDAVVLLKDFLHSPVSVTSEWPSNTSATTTQSSYGDRFSMKNDSNTYIKAHGEQG